MSAVLSHSLNGFSIANLTSSRRITNFATNLEFYEAPTCADTAFTELASQKLLDWAVSLRTIPFYRQGSQQSVAVYPRSENPDENVLLGFIKLAMARHSESAFSVVGVSGTGRTVMSAIRRQFVALELASSTELRPDSYQLPTGETTFDFFSDRGRITCVFDENYGHVLSEIDGELNDRYFEGDDYDASKIGAHFRAVVSRLQVGN